jgi:membrane associated rhomboid family serine protease
MSSLTPERRKLPNLKTHALLIGGLIVVLWFLELVDLLPFINLNRYGIVPWEVEGLKGIVLSPLLHSGFPHLMANTVPLALLAWLIMLRSYRDLAIVTMVSMLIGGMGTWLFGGLGTNHIGASGLVFGYFGFLLARAIVERSLPAISAALVVIMLYGSLIWGIFPLVQGVSWQMHLFGMIGGIFAAWILPTNKPELDEPDEDDPPYLRIRREELERW